MNAPPVLEIWPLAFTREQAAVVEQALKDDGYALDKDGLRDWVVDGIKLRHPDVLAKVQKWMRENPEKVGAFRNLTATLGRNIPAMLRAWRQAGAKTP
jgi:hypothetical protein